MKEQFRKLFWNTDIMGLAGMVGPENSDEYDGEADMAFENINTNDSIEQIKLKLLSVFKIWFTYTEHSPEASKCYEEAELNTYVEPSFQLINDFEIEHAETEFNSSGRIDKLAKDIKDLFNENNLFFKNS